MIIFEVNEVLAHALVKFKLEVTLLHNSFYFYPRLQLLICRVWIPVNFPFNFTFLFRFVVKREFINFIFLQVYVFNNFMGFTFSQCLHIFKLGLLLHWSIFWKKENFFSHLLNQNDKYSWFKVFKSLISSKTLSNWYLYLQTRWSNCLQNYIVKIVMDF